MSIAEEDTTYALSKDGVFEAVGYRPHRGQKPIHASPARHRVAACGRRFGKSTIGGNDLVPEALLTYTKQNELIDSGHRREFWIVGPEYSDSEKEFRVVYNALKKLQVPFDHPGTYNNPEAGNMHISLWEGKFQIHAKSAKYPQTLVGEGLSGVILAEAAKLKRVVWTKYIRPTLADFRGWSLHTSTPEGKNWFYESWQKGQDPHQRHWESWRRPSWSNDVVFPHGGSMQALSRIRDHMKMHGYITEELALEFGMDPEILDMLMDMSDEKFNQEVAADFTEYVGRVFKDFEEETHVTDLNYDPSRPLYAATDYGWSNPFVWLLIQTDVWDNVHVIGEYRAIHKDIQDIAAELERNAINRKVNVLYPEPASPGDTEILRKVLRCKVEAGTGGELKWRLELIRQALKLKPEHVPDGHPDKRPKLLIDRSCHGLIREMQDYRYPESKEEQVRQNPEQPMDKDDHGPEALGRFFRGYFGGPAANGGRQRATVKRARISGNNRRAR